MTNYDSYYDYKELREKALSQYSTANDRINLFNWLENHCYRAWNGEYYDIDDGLRLLPVWKQIEEDEFELIDCEIK